jgi:hypothetical protein
MSSSASACRAAGSSLPYEGQQLEHLGRIEVGSEVIIAPTRGSNSPAFDMDQIWTPSHHRSYKGRKRHRELDAVG